MKELRLDAIRAFEYWTLDQTVWVNWSIQQLLKLALLELPRCLICLVVFTQQNSY